MLNFLYLLIVKPLEMLIEYFFNEFLNLSLIYENIVLDIIIISFVVSLLCLPLYLKADKIQEEENEIQKKLSKKVDIIKKNFKGDERQMLLQTYYRQNNYHPIMGLRLSLSLLLQIPIFIAAYVFFSNLSMLNGLSCGAIKNLAAPDGLLVIGGININILPFLMTLVNLNAGYIYSKDKTLKGNKVLIIMSLIFLILLYNAPSALVLYWLFNNIFSLIKNICLRLISEKNIKFKIPENFKNKFSFLNIDFDYKSLFICSVIACWVLFGCFISSEVLASSPSEFMFDDGGPIDILFFAISVYAGVFLFWGSWIYYLSNIKLKKILSASAFLFFIYSVINLFLIKMPNEIILNTFIYEKHSPNFSNYLMSNKWLWLSVLIIGIVFSLILVCRNKLKYAKIFLILISISCFLVSGCNFIKISKEVIISNQKNVADLKKYDENKKYINLSKKKKNVLIIFVDRAIGSYLPIAFEEDSKLSKQFEGFTYYPNTFSYSRHTILGYLPILGGYEYSPLRFDEQKGTFVDKYYQAVTTLPAIFSKNNWSVTIVNPTTHVWNSQKAWNISDDDNTDMGNNKNNPLNNDNIYKKFSISIKDVPSNIKDSLKGKYKIEKSDKSKRNIIYYSLISASPSLIRKYIYDEGHYHKSRFEENYYSPMFIKNYIELLLLKNFTKFSQTDNTFTLFNNKLTHDPQLLNYPNYDLTGTNDKNYTSPMDMNDIFTLQHYHVNMAALKLLGKYMDFLRNKEVYDNTRIIIVSDHGNYGLKTPNGNEFIEKYFIRFNPLLMVKDFNQNEEFKTDETIMTNADVPVIAAKGLIDNPVNPYTHKIITDRDKSVGIIIKEDKKWQPYYYIEKPKVCQDDDTFHYYIKGNPMDKNKWILDMDYNTALKLYKSKFSKY